MNPTPSADEIETMLTIASRVPDHARLIPWRFIVIERERAQRLGDAIAAAYESDHPDADDERISSERGLLTRAPLVIGVVSRTQPHPKVPEWEQILSAGAACMSLVMAVNALGYAANWHTEWYAYDSRVLDVLGLHASERIAGFIHIGTPAERPAERPRPDLDAIVTYFGVK